MPKVQSYKYAFEENRGSKSPVYLSNGLPLHEEKE